MDREVIFKIATEPHEFEEIHRLNYRTFVEEIPQHRAPPGGRLVDRRHAENTYVIGLAGEELVAMVALRARRPFSPGRRACEIRLLSVRAPWRKTTVFTGLVSRLAELARMRGYDLALISGTPRELKLYGHLGFVPFGPGVGSATAPYQPMMLTLERFEDRAHRRIEDWRARGGATVSFMPGPVEIAKEVRAAFALPPQSHRSEAFSPDARRDAAQARRAHRRGARRGAARIRHRCERRRGGAARSARGWRASDMRSPIRARISSSGTGSSSR